MLAHVGHQLANWLEYYAEAMELNVWTSTSVESVRLQDDGRYEVVVKKADGTTRTFHVAHVIMALGFGGGVPNMPTFPGQVGVSVFRPAARKPMFVPLFRVHQDEFQGQIIHSTQHKTARDHIGKKVVIVGACTSGKTCRIPFTLLNR